MKYCVVGSGFTGSILANHLANKGYSVDVYESRDHIGGNCYTYRDKNTNILVHKYGPHIFHTDNVNVWNFVNNLTNFVPFINRVKATLNGKVYSLPINLHTINQFFDKNLPSMKLCEKCEISWGITRKSAKLREKLEPKKKKLI